MGRRFWVALIALVVLAAVIVGVLEVQRHDRSGSATGKGQAGGAAAHRARGSRATSARKPPPPPPAVVATLLAWRLPVPVSRAVVLPGPGTDLVVTGGLTPSGASGNGAFLVSTHTGAIHLVAGLVAAVYDASGAILAGRDVIFGGAATGTGGTGTGGTGTGGTRTGGTGTGGTGASPMVQIFRARRARRCPLPPCRWPRPT